MRNFIKFDLVVFMHVLRYRDRLLNRKKANKELEHDDKAIEHAMTGETVETEKKYVDERKKIEEERRRKKREKKKKMKEEGKAEKKKKKKKKQEGKRQQHIPLLFLMYSMCVDDESSKGAPVGPVQKYMTKNRPLRPRDITEVDILLLWCLILYVNLCHN